MSTLKPLLKSGALALALAAAVAVPNAAQARAHHNTYYYRRNQRPSFTGVVTKRHSDNHFDVRMNGKIYNVYTNRRLPRGLKTDDVVRIHGYRTGSNDIRDAWATVIRHR